MNLLKEVLSTDKGTNIPKTTKRNAEYLSAVDILWERSEPVTPDAESDPSKPKDYNKVGSSPINAEGQELDDKLSWKFPQCNAGQSSASSAFIYSGENATFDENDIKEAYDTI